MTFMVRARVLTLLSLFALLSVDASMAGGAATTRPMATDVGQWWQARGDRKLTGRAHLKGEISKGAIAWKYRVAARETLLRALDHMKANLLADEEGESAAAE